MVPAIHRRLMSTGRAHPQPSRGGPRLGPVAGGAHELLPPAEPRQVLAARLLGREAGFELPERARVVLHSLNHYRLGLLESREYPHVDKSDGTIDGVPGVGLDRQSVGPWIDLVRRKMAEIEGGRSDIDRYALTNEAEFFAVTSEYFFERPAMMQRKHPHLYAALERVFNQDLFTRAAQFKRELTSPRPTFGRNSPCPCGSGRKFKKCCLN